jgi:FAD/FMN-containing dehydrogenase
MDPIRGAGSGDYAARRARLQAQIAAGEGAVGLRKDTSNLFRDRAEGAKRRLDVRGFCHVLALDPQQAWVEAEGMTTYEDLVAACLAREVMPCVVPQLKTITLGGAAAGVGIEASSFRCGLVHETVIEMDILTGAGEVVTCRPDGPDRELFFGFPNSYGTLGYALRLKIRTVPVKPFVELRHVRHEDPGAFFAALEQACKGEADFVDGVVFGSRELTLNICRFIERAPWVSDYTFERIYYRSIRERELDYLTAADFLWRWDTDWFWCSKNLGAQNPLLRRLLGRERLNSRFYTRMMRWNSRVGLTRLLDRLAARQAESVIQDVDIPIGRAAEFLDFFHREVGILPIWICPFRAFDPVARFPLYAYAPDTLYVNFGFWDVVRSRRAHPPGHFNRLVEAKVHELGGIKSLYSDSYYDPETFWCIYDRETYRSLKARYDPDGLLGDLYRKCVLRE